MEYFRTILLAGLVLACVGCASDRSFVAEAESWWEEEYGDIGRNYSVMRADGYWAENRARRKASYAASIAHAEEVFAEEQEHDAYHSSLAKLEDDLDNNDSWQKMVRRHSLTQAERDWAHRASRR